jgi:hypothetical protein
MSMRCYVTLRYARNRIDIWLVVGLGREDMDRDGDVAEDERGGDAGDHKVAEINSGPPRPVDEERSAVDGTCTLVIVVELRETHSIDKMATMECHLYGNICGIPADRAVALSAWLRRIYRRTRA